MFTVDLIVTVIKAVRKPERFHPLTQIVPSLRQHFRYLHNFADINLQVYSEDPVTGKTQPALPNPYRLCLDYSHAIQITSAA